MSSFDYIKTAIRQKGAAPCSKVAEASGMTKGYLSQLLNAKIKSPSAQKLEALHRFLGLEFPRMQKNIGVVFRQVLSAAYRACLPHPARL
ncbi:Trifunctional NAD biosynthesis/regulator protein NadR [Leclercia adecarboxylata]|uniref:Trifunctional NAD biosynthesis/regulator protein NadR n=1 Tax=Leclercia adecarboxylata TaxID=83655 RepID=A0A4U9HI25_9ENTR|nr:Trifunctional NAD biosynthesis/regulator protein NadR [Leclercia adecarboxylata]